MDLTLIIPAYNEEGEIVATLDAAKKYAGSRLREIIVVDNASTDRTGEIAREHGATVVREDKKGLPHARTAGFLAAKTPLIAYIDADSHISPERFTTAEKIFSRPPHIVALREVLRDRVVARGGPRGYFGTSAARLWILNGFWLFAPLVYWLVGYMILGGNFIAR